MGCVLWKVWSVFLMMGLGLLVLCWLSRVVFLCVFEAKGWCFMYFL